jgi:hypothetical protein
MAAHKSFLQRVNCYIIAKTIWEKGYHLARRSASRGAAAGKTITFLPNCFSCIYLFLLVFSQSA